MYTGDNGGDDHGSGSKGKQRQQGGRFRVVLLTKRMEAQHWEALLTMWRERGTVDRE